MLLKTQSEMYS